jgi:hypothetical protein
MNAAMRQWTRALEKFCRGGPYIEDSVGLDQADSSTMMQVLRVIMAMLMQLATRSKINEWIKGAGGSKGQDAQMITVTILKPVCRPLFSAGITAA